MLRLCRLRSTPSSNRSMTSAQSWLHGYRAGATYNVYRCPCRFILGTTEPLSFRLQRGPPPWSLTYLLTDIYVLHELADILLCLLTPGALSLCDRTLQCAAEHGASRDGGGQDLPRGR